MQCAENANSNVSFQVNASWGGGGGDFLRGQPPQDVSVGSVVV